MSRKKKITKSSISRLVFVLISLALQVIWIVLSAWFIRSHFTILSAFIRVAVIIVVLSIYWKQMNAAIKMPWMILIIIFPVLGLSLYGLLGRRELTKKQRQCFEKIDAELFEKLSQDQTVCEALRRENVAAANQAGYIWKYGSYPMYRNTDITFLEDTSKGFERQIQALRQAEKFIFLEYYAIEDGRSFQKIKEILFEKVRQGVEVRIIYDDVGSISFIGRKFRREMEAHGIGCRVFNPLVPLLNPFINNRDHRKIMVVDGQTGFTGGYNLADEYFNLTHPYGHWKDTGVELKGDAVESLTVMFLEMWNAIEKSDADYDRYLSHVSYRAEEDGFIQPYADSPLDAEPIGENVYMNMIKSADRYIYFMTPYLMITDEMMRELKLAAKRGVDVRIITPGIPDIKMIYQATRSYYRELLKAEVRIFEYTPGLCHGKQCVCDDIMAVVGTINLDYRSLYLHFEDSVFFCGCNAVGDVKKDFDSTFPLCREVEEMKQSWMEKLWREILRLFAPLM